jgi:glutamate synthase (NADPH/NADH) small chain
MEKRHLDRRLAQMAAEGTQFRSGVSVGEDVSAEALRKKYDVVVLAGGATIPRDLPVPGRHYDGIHFAMEFLPLSNKLQEGDVFEDSPAPDLPPLNARGKHVVIIGGGDTGADCLGTSIRQGAASVTQLEILPRPPAERSETMPWPTYPMIYRVSSAHEEAGERMFAVSTKHFNGDELGKVTGLTLSEIHSVDGRFEEVPGTERTIPCDLALLAMGFTGPQRGGLLEQLGVDYDTRGNVARTSGWATNVPGVFVAGDMGRGQSLIVWAIAEGRACASAVDEYLSGETALPAPIRPTDRPLV